MSIKPEVHLHGEGQPSPIVIQLPDRCTVRDIVAAAQKAGAVAADVNLNELFVFIVDVDDPLSLEKQIEHGEKRTKLHSHRCRKIEVAVTFNMIKKSQSFAPSALVRRVLKWALHEFHLVGADADGKELRIGGPNGKAMLEDSPIGSYVQHPSCEILTYLTDIVQVQG